MDRLSQEQQRRNIAAAAAWTLYAPHRNRVTQLLLDARSPSAKRLCLLGAGNLNDFDLARLLPAFSEVVLVDVDAESMRRGLAAQGFTDNDRVQIIAPADVTGVFAELSLLSPSPPANDELIERCLNAFGEPSPFRLDGSCDVVASVGLLTQLIDAVIRSVGEAHPRFWDLVSAVRLQHLLLLLELTRPGGAAQPRRDPRTEDVTRRLIE